MNTKELAPHLQTIWHEHESKQPYFLYRDKIIFTCSTPMLIDEVFVKQLYFINDNKNYVVVDIGANVGIVSLYFAFFNNVEKIYAYEPVEETFNTFVQNVNYNLALKNKIEMMNLAIGAEDGETEIYIPENNILASSLYPHFKDSQNIKTQTIQMKEATKELSKIIANHPNNRILLKIDTEGSEYEILENLYESKLLEKISTLFVEFHGGRKSIPGYFTELFDYEVIDHIDSLFFIKALRKKNTMEK